jgi:hypothetical protein
MITAIELPPGNNDPRLMARVKTADGKDLLIFDPTDEETPVGLIRGELQGAYGDLADGAASQVDETPDPVKLDLPFASYRSSVAARGDVLHFEREYVVKQVEVPATDAAEFRKLEDMILSDEKSMAVLKKQ